jgi:DNA-binding CsgD family transcriptional regulator
VARLTTADYRKTLDLIYAAGEVDGPLAFTDPVLRALRDLVPCDVVTFHERSRSPQRVLVHAGEPLGKVTPEIREAHRRLAAHDPVQRAAGGQRLTDVVSLRRFRRSEFYDQLHRPLGIEYMLWLYLDPQTTDARLELDRSDEDFGDRDVAILNLLAPHLRQAAQTARRHVPRRPGSDPLTRRERQIVHHVGAGRTNREIGHTLNISPETVRKHLENIYEKLDVHTRTAAVAATFGHPAD